MSDDSYLDVSEDKEENQENKSNSSNNNEEEIFDSLNINTKKKTKQNKITVNNEDSALEEVYASLSGVPQKNENEENNIKENIKNNYSIDNNSKSENENENEKDDKKNNDEENVNLGNSFSKISERDKYKNDINEENNKKEKEVVTPNTSIYNLSETLTKRSGKENNNINNIEITNKNITNNIKDINENKEETQINGNKKIESFNIFDDDSLIYNKKENNSMMKNSINPNEENNKLLYNINIQFSRIRKPNENENDGNNENNDIFGDKIINLTDKNIKNNNRKTNTKNIILKKFEQIKKNEVQKNDIETIKSIKSPLDNNTNNILYKEQETENDKISKNFMTNPNPSKENNYIYLCPFCNKETPEIKKIEGIQVDIKTPTIDKILISCKCGIHELNLDEYIQKIEQEIEFNNLKDFCYNENHDYIKAVSYCSKCDKWFCQQCLLYHQSLLPDHIVTPTKIPRHLKCEKHGNGIIYFCIKCNIGVCEKCKCEYHNDHLLLTMEEYFNQIYSSLPFKSFEELNEFIEHCNRISEKGKNSYVNYIDDMINKLNSLKNDIIENYNQSKNRRLTQQKLIKYLFGNFICFNENIRQIQNLDLINFICPSLFLYNDINFLKAANNYSLYLKKESFIEINQDKKLNKEELNKIFEKYKPSLKEEKFELDEKNNYNSNKHYLNTLQSESNIVYPTLFKIYNNTGIYYGEIENNKRNGVGKQFNKKNEFEGIWENGEIIKGKAIYYSDQGNIIYEGGFKDGLENGYGEKIYPDQRVYKGNFINGKIETKYNIEKKLELDNF